MNYLKEILAFHNWLETNQCDATEQALWFHLMDLNNKCGWSVWFTVANMTLQARLGGIDKKTLDRKRNSLCLKRRIEYISQGKKLAGKYRIIPFGDDIRGIIPLETGQSVSNLSLNPPPLFKENINETEKDIIPFAEIIKSLNEEAGTNYKSTTNKTRDRIRARWNEGFRMPDFLAVNRKKATQWKGTENAQYLRPETLYGNKFEGYLNQPEIIPGGRASPPYNGERHQREEEPENDWGWKKN